MPFECKIDPSFANNNLAVFGTASDQFCATYLVQNWSYIQVQNDPNGPRSS